MGGLLLVNGYQESAKLVNSFTPLTSDVTWRRNVILTTVFITVSDTQIIWCPADPSGRAVESVVLRLHAVGSNPTRGMDVCLLWVLSGRGLCDELIVLPEESYRLWYVVVCDLEISWMRRPWPTGGCCARKQNWCPVVWKWVRPMAPAVSCWPLTVEARVHSQASLCGICDRQSGTGTQAFLRVLRFSSLSIIPTKFHTYSLIYNRRSTILQTNNTVK